MLGLASDRSKAGEMVLDSITCLSRQLHLPPLVSALPRLKQLFIYPDKRVRPVNVMDNSSCQNTIGILYPGEMGSTVGKLLCESGFRVITTVEGRSPRTQQLCREAGLNVVNSLDDILRHSDIVISLVSPSAALPVALEVGTHLEGSSRRLLYIDANSISPMTVAQISEVF